MRLIAPNPGPQMQFLSSPADIAIFGGGAGSGKTWALLLGGLRHVKNPLYKGITFRRVSTQITTPDGLWDKSHELFSLVNGVSRKRPMGWTFPSGATEAFAHLQHEDTKFSYQGMAAARISFDELTHFSETQFWYLVSRNRSVSGIKPYIRGTCNADSESWVRDLIAWWIDEDSGFPIEERSGVIRYFVRDDDNNLLWADSAEELYEEYPMIAHPVDNPPYSFTFIPAKITDNPKLLEVDPGYLTKLNALPYVERMQLLDNNWNIKADTGTIFNKEWFNYIRLKDLPYPIAGSDTIFWDLAATEEDLLGKSNKKPSATAAVHIRRNAGKIYVLNSIEFKKGPADVERLFLQINQDWTRGLPSPLVRWEREPGSASKRESERLNKLLHERGMYDTADVPPQGDKYERARGISAACYDRNVYLVHADWNERFANHLHSQPQAAQDTMDALSGAFNYSHDPTYTGPSANVVRGGRKSPATRRRRRNPAARRPTSKGGRTRRPIYTRNLT